MKRYFISCLFLLILIIFGSNQTSAQTCASQRVVDEFECLYDPLFSPGCSVSYIGPKTLSCSMQGSDCLTNNFICSSNDSCNPGASSAAECSASCPATKAECWIGGSGPTPTPSSEWCGDGKCNGAIGEFCSTCSADCGGSCPPPTCTVNFDQPAGYTMKLSDNTVRVQALPTNLANGTVTYTRFRSRDIDIFLIRDQLSPTYENVQIYDDYSSPYLARIIPQARGTSEIVARVAMNNTNNICSRIAPLTVTAPDPPSVDLKVNGSDGPIEVNMNDFVNLTWTSTATKGRCNASSSMNDWTGEKDRNGGETVGPVSNNREYIIECYGWEGMTTRDSVEVTLPGPKIDLKANGSDGPVTIASGSNVNLTWSGENIQDCFASNAWSGLKPTTGNELRTNVTTGNYSYDITCNSAIVGFGPTSDTVRVDAVPPTVDLKVSTQEDGNIDTSPASPAITTVGSNVDLVWTVSGFTSGLYDCIASESPNIETNWTTSTPAGVKTQSLGGLGFETGVGPINSYRQLTLTCTDAINPSIVDSDTVYVSTPQPTVDLKINGSDGPVTVPYNQTASMSWITNSSVTSCSVPAPSVPWPNGITSPDPLGNVTQIGPITSTTNQTYAIQCQDAGGNTVTDSVSIRANAVPCAPVSNIIVNQNTCSTPAGDGSITWNWTASSNADAYNISIYDQTNTLVQTANGITTTSYTATGLEPNESYTISVVATGAVCAPNSAVQSSASEAVAMCTYTISGYVYVYNEDDVSYDSTAEQCLFDTGVPTGPLTGYAGATVTINGVSGVTDASGYYEVTPQMAGGGNQLISISNYDINLPFCPSTGTYSVPETDASNLNFFTTGEKDPWFQVEGGDIHVNHDGGDDTTSSFVNPVSIACRVEDLCFPYTIKRTDTSIPDTSGFLTYSSGIIDTWSNSSSQIKNVTEDDVDINTARISQATIDRPRENFGYLYRNHEFGLNPTNYYNPTAGRDPNDAQLPSGTPPNGDPAYYTDQSIVINDPWVVPAGEKKVLFVDGDVEIRNTITVPNTAFLAIISSQNIFIRENVDLAQGVFLADGRIEVQSRGDDPSTDVQFVGEGTFVGWGGIDFNRNLPDNNSTPAVLIRYRPDFMQNAPAGFITKRYRWEQVAP